ncbi:MAG: hypothetical protein COB15_12625 [Flavobacteriales bacterium]|nr:MAG: hypothetical protein COB15_12625 [Flavobacteriales bacterium]
MKLKSCIRRIFLLLLNSNLTTMKIKSTLLVALIILTSVSFGQETLLMYRDNGLWGVMNLKGEVLVEKKFGVAKPFKNGMAKVGKFQFVDTKGEVFHLRNYIKRNLLDCREFSEGLLGVKVSSAWGFLNKEGKLVVPAIYKYITDFNSGYAAVRKKEGFFIIDKNGVEQKVINNHKKKVSYIKKFSEGLAPIERNGLWGFVNGEGNIVIEPIYLAVGYFKGGVAWARMEKGGKVGFLKKDGSWKVEPILNAAKDFDLVSGLAKIHDGKGWCYLNIDGKVKRFENSRDNKRFSDGMCPETATMGNAKSGYLDSDGNWATKREFGIATHFNNGYAAVRKNNKWGVIDKKGNWILEPKYSYIKGFYTVD